MYGTRARLDPRFSPTASSLDTVIGVKVVEIVTRFLTPLLDFEDTCWSNVFSNSSYSTWLGICPFFLFWDRYWHSWQGSRYYNPILPIFHGTRNLVGGLDPSLGCKGSLLSRKRLFSTRRVSRGGVGGLILSTGVFLLFFSVPVLSGTSRVYVTGTSGGLEHCICLRVNGFLHSLFPGVQVTGSGIQLGPYRRFQAFQEALDHDLLFWSCIRIKFSENRLQVLQVRCPVEDFLLLMLGVSLELSPVGIHKSLWVTQASSEEYLKLVPRDRDRDFDIMSPLILLLAEANPVPKERHGKKNSGRLRNSSSSKVVFTLLKL